MTERHQFPPFSPNSWMRWDVIQRQLPDADRSIRVLEVGCGQGSMGARLAARYTYLGVEPDSSSFDVACRRIAPFGGTVLNTTSASIDAGDFDLLASFEVIEHIADDQSELIRWAHLLRPGGRVVLSTPAWQHRFGAADELVGHHRRYDPSDLESKLRDAGFTDIRIVHFGMPIGYVLETARNLISARRLRARSSSTVTDSNDERSAASGRMLQPSRRMAAFVSEWATYPFRVVQRAFPGTGPGLVAFARRPD